MKKLSIIIASFVVIISGLVCSAGYEENAVAMCSEAKLGGTSVVTTQEETTTFQTKKTTTEPVATTTKKTTQTTTNTATTKNTTKTSKTTTAKTTVEYTATAKSASTGKSLGTFKITVYTPGSDGGSWGYQTATGVRSQHLKTCAVDPKVIPLGSTIYVNGLTLLACDTGSAVKGNVIDIFYDGSDSAACKWVSDFGTRQEVKI